MPWLIGIAILLWAIFGSPKNDVANWFWSDKAAPWEDATAFYYPDRSNLSKSVSSGVGGVDECRDWVYAQAARRNDPNIQRGDYECGVGFLRMFGGLKVYRITVQ